MAHAFEQEVEAVYVGLRQAAAAGVVRRIVRLGHVVGRFSTRAETELFERDRDLWRKGVVDLRNIDISRCEPGIGPQFGSNVTVRADCLRQLHLTWGGYWYMKKRIRIKLGRGFHDYRLWPLEMYFNDNHEKKVEF